MKGAQRRAARLVGLEFAYGIHLAGTIIEGSDRVETWRADPSATLGGDEIPEVMIVHRPRDRRLAYTRTEKPQRRRVKPIPVTVGVDHSHGLEIHRGIAFAILCHWDNHFA